MLNFFTSIIAAFLVNSFIFPYHARVRYFHCLATTLDKLAELCESSRRDAECHADRWPQISP